MWTLLENHLEKFKLVVNLKSSYYCGDSAGRVNNHSTHRKDLSCADLLFATNVGIKFMIPEEIFVWTTSRKHPDLNLADISEKIEALEAFKEAF